MENPKFVDWDVDLSQGFARHVSGFNLCIEGDPKDPSSVSPADFPERMSAAEQAGLLREGMAALAAAGRAFRSTAATTKTSAQLAAEARAKLFAERPDKPDRPRLSLKKPRGA